MIRAADTSDAASITRLWNWMIRDTLATFTAEEKSVETLECLLEARKGAFFVAEENGELRGFVTFGQFRAGPGYAATCEHSIVVAPEAQGQKFGKALMARAMASARDNGMHVIVGALSSANPQAVAFHKAVGFVQVGYMPQVGSKSGQWLDLILMQKNLSESV